MIPRAAMDARPVLIAIAGPNGAGKTTFYHSHLAAAGLRFINADVLAIELQLEAYAAARLAAALRDECVARRESLVFETVFSDPVGDKIATLVAAARRGYSVILCFIGIAGPEQSDCRVAMRVSQGGHDVPREKVFSRYPRVMQNLRLAIQTLPLVLVYDNSDLGLPYRWVATFERSHLTNHQLPLPAWLDEAVK